MVARMHAFIQVYLCVHFCECIMRSVILSSAEYPEYQRFFLACDEELCCFRRKAKDTSGEAFSLGHFEDWKPETVHEKPLGPRVSAELNIFSFKQVKRRKKLDFWYKAGMC